MTTRRTKARERALQALYQIDVAAEGIDDALSRFWKSFEPVEREVMDLAESLVRGVAQHRRELDDAIEAVSTHWRLDRMAKVDRNVLRLATFELLRTEVPVKVRDQRGHRAREEVRLRELGGLRERPARQGGERAAARAAPGGLVNRRGPPWRS